MIKVKINGFETEAELEVRPGRPSAIFQAVYFTKIVFDEMTVRVALRPEWALETKFKVEIAGKELSGRRKKIAGDRLLIEVQTPEEAEFRERNRQDALARIDRDQKILEKQKKLDEQKQAEALSRTKNSNAIVITAVLFLALGIAMILIGIGIACSN